MGRQKTQGFKSNSKLLISSDRKGNNHFQQYFTQQTAKLSQGKLKDKRAYNQNGMQNNNIPGRAVQLMVIRADGQVQVNDQALDIIGSYNDKPVGFVALLGKYRTGKSFLLNKLLSLESNGFKVQQQANACTQGIWMWTNPLLNQYLENYIFFLDTQGLARKQKGEQNDIRIFTLTTLLSSYLIYNSIGKIDERAISDLNVVSKLASNIMAEESFSIQQNQERLQDFMPKFCWVLRDFTLRLQDKTGRNITPKQYLQDSLKQENTHVGIQDDLRRIKRSLLVHFKDRDCITLVRPVQQQNLIRSPNGFSDVSQTKQFTQGVNALRQKILKNAGCKQFQGKELYGNDMVCIIQAYAMAINQGKTPSIKSAYQQIADNQGNNAYSMAHQKYLQLFQDHFSSEQPKQHKQLQRLLSLMKEQGTLQFKRNSSSEQHQEYYLKLGDWITRQQQAITQANFHAMNLQVLKQQSQDLMRSVQSSQYAGRKQHYLSDLQNVLKRYRRRAVGGAKQALLSQFIQTTNMIAINLDKQHQNHEANQYLASKAKKQMENKSKPNHATVNVYEEQTLHNSKRTELKKINKSNQKKIGCCAGNKCQII